jgi:hypothetical protein
LVLLLPAGLDLIVKADPCQGGPVTTNDVITEIRRLKEQPGLEMVHTASASCRTCRRDGPAI